MWSQLLINIILATSIYLLVAVSYYNIYTATKEFSLSQAITISIAPYILYCFQFQLGLSTIISILLSIFFSIVIGIIPEIFIYRHLRKKNANSFFILLASLGYYIIAQNCISMIWGDDIKSIRIGEVKIGHQLIDAYITDIQILTIIICTIIFVLWALFIKKHRIGRMIRAVSNNTELCDILGINSNKVILFAFVISSVLAAIAGILVAYDTDITPSMGFNLLFYGVVAMIIGGVGSIWGIVLGALLLAISQHLIAYYIGSQWMEAIAYFILILFLLWKPLGFAGRRLKKVEI